MHYSFCSVVIQSLLLLLDKKIILIDRAEIQNHIRALPH